MKLSSLNKYWFAAVFYLCVVMGMSGPVSAEPALSENELKALYLFNFSFFVQWPDSCTSNSECDAFNFCATSSNEVTTKLNSLIANESFGSQPVNLLISPKPEVYSKCHVFYIDQSNEYQLHTLLDQLRPLPILTVSDIEHFIVKGGMIGFTRTQKRIVPSINNSLAVEHGLKISSKLLKIAHEVR